MSRRPSTRTLLVVGLLVALLVGGGLSLAASSSPDGLERVADDQGFAERERPHAAGEGPFAGYRARGVGDGDAAGVVAGLVGTLVVLGLAGGIFVVLRRRDPESS